MSPPDPKPDPTLDPLSDAFVGVHNLRDDAPLSDELCLFVESLRLDERELPPTLDARVQAYVAERPELRRAVAELALHHELLSTAPALRVPDGFAERVLAARPVHTAAGRPVLRRLAAAAALLLAVSLGWELTHPVHTLADADTARGRWIVDELQPDPFGPLEIDAALRERLPGPLDAAGEPAAPPSDAEPPR